MESFFVDKNLDVEKARELEVCYLLEPSLEGKIPNLKIPKIEELVELKEFGVIIPKLRSNSKKEEFVARKMFIYFMDQIRSKNYFKQYEKNNDIAMLDLFNSIRLVKEKEYASLKQRIKQKKLYYRYEYQGVV